jgi:hypothetical protein
MHTFVFDTTDVNKFDFCSISFSSCFVAIFFDTINEFDDINDVLLAIECTESTHVDDSLTCT